MQSCPYAVFVFELDFTIYVDSFQGAFDQAAIQLSSLPPKHSPSPPPKKNTPLHRRTIRCCPKPPRCQVIRLSQSELCKENVLAQKAEVAGRKWDKSLKEKVNPGCFLREQSFPVNCSRQWHWPAKQKPFREQKLGQGRSWRQKLRTLAGHASYPTNSIYWLAWLIGGDSVSSSWHWSTWSATLTNSEVLLSLQSY